MLTDLVALFCESVQCDDEVLRLSLSMPSHVGLNLTSRHRRQHHPDFCSYCPSEPTVTMPLTHRILARATTVSGRQAATPSLARSYATRYPFTPDSSVTPQANEAATRSPLSPYPFTKPGQPTPQQSNQASPVGPTPTSARPGPEMKDSELRQADEGDRSQQDMMPKQPDYNVASDYRTSYVQSYMYGHVELSLTRI